MIPDKEEKLIIKQLEAVNDEFRIVCANMTILKNYFETLVESYKDKKYIE